MFIMLFDILAIKYRKRLIMNIALIVAAGSGSRMENASKPKQFLLVKEKPLMLYSVKAFQMHENIDAIVIVTNTSYIEQVKEWCKEYQLNKVRLVVSGGITRQESVCHGLEAVKSISLDPENDVVLIHDSARPLVDKAIISANITACNQYGATCTAIKVKDTIARSLNGQTISGVANRQELYQCQTPQAFKLSLILAAHAQSKDNIATDDAQLVLALGKDVYLVDGNSLNFKITTDADLLLLNALLK